MSDASTVSLSGETSKATVAKFGMAAIGFVGTVIFARVLGSEDLGSYFLVFAAAELAVRPVAGIGEAVQKRASEVDTPGGEAFGGQLLFNTTWMLVVLLAAILFAGRLNEYFSLPNGALLFALLVLGEGIYMNIPPMIQARGRIGIATGIDALRSYATFALQVGLLLLGYGVSGLVYGLASASVFVIPVAFRYHVVRPKLPTREMLSRIWSFGKYSTLNAFLAKTYERFDELLLGLLLTGAAVGNYGVAARLTIPAIFVSSVAAQGLMARVSNLSSKEKSVAADISNTLAFTSILSVPLFFGSLVTAREVVLTIYGSEFTGAASLLIGLAFARLVGSQIVPLGRALEGIDRPRTNMRISLVTLLINILLGVVLTLRYGTIGVVIATAIAELLKYGFTAYVVRIELPDVTFVPNAFLKQLLAGSAMMVILIAIKQVVLVDYWVDLVVILGAGGLSYFGVLATISSQFRTTMLAVVEESVGTDI